MKDPRPEEGGVVKSIWIFFNQYSPNWQKLAARPQLFKLAKRIFPWKCIKQKFKNVVAETQKR